MNNKYIRLLYILLIFMVYGENKIWAQEPMLYTFNYDMCYTLSDWKSLRDFNTGEYITSPGDAMNFHARNKLVNVSIEWYRPNRDIQHTYYKALFSGDGLLLSEEENYFEKKITTYKYDIERKLIESGSDIKFSYNNDTRSVYYQGQLQEIDSIEQIEKGYKVRRESSPYVNIWKDLNVSISEYIFIAGKPQSISDINRVGKKSEFWYIWTFEYEQDRLKKIIEVDKNNQLRQEILITAYFENGNIKSIIRNQYENIGKQEYIWYFSDYDVYGNWTKAICNKNGKLYEEVKRTFIYAK